MSNKYVWVCDYCGGEFPTKKKRDQHEEKCLKRKPDMKKIWEKNKFILIFILIAVAVYYFLTQPTETKKSTYRPTPTPDPDPYTTCSWPGENGEEYCPPKKMRNSACMDSICCNLGNGTWASMDKVECAKLQAELRQKEVISRPQIPAPQFIQHEAPKVPAIEPPNVKCNFDYLGNWVCKPSW